MERRFHSPYKHWISGFAFEVAIFSAFVVVMALVALVARLVFG